MTVYFVQTESGSIKIGSANNPESRLRIFQNGSVEDLRLLGTMPGGLVREKEIQRQFGYLRLKGEWFSPEPELMKFIELHCNPKIIIFEVNDQKFPLEIIDHNGDRWVTRRQLEDALGVNNLRMLHSRLVELRELKEGIHFVKVKLGSETIFDPETELSNDSLLNSLVPKSKGKSSGNPFLIIYSYRGIIRVSMASEGKNAIDFRDWAEKVLYEVMTTGSYGEADNLKEIKQQIEMIKVRLAFIEGKSHFNSLPAPAYKAPIRAFVSAWWNKFGDKEVTIRELYPIIKHEKLSLDISAKTELGEKVRLSNMMKKFRSMQFELILDTARFDIILCQTGRRNKSLTWQLRKNEESLNT